MIAVMRKAIKQRCGHLGVAEDSRGEQEWRWCGLAPPGEDIDHHRGGVDAVVESFSTGGLHGGQPIIGDTTEDLDHLPIAIVSALQLAPDGCQCWR
jgi:hypothetical protein